MINGSAHNADKPVEHSYFRSKGVRMKLLLSFVLLIVVTTSLMFYITYTNTRRLARENLLDKMELLSTVFSTNIDQEICRTVKAIDEVADRLVDKHLDRPTLYTFFMGTFVLRANLDTVYVYNSNKRLVYTDAYIREGITPHNGIADEPEVIQAINEKRTIVYPMRNKFNHHNGVFIAKPVFDKTGKLKGIIIAEKTLDSSMMETSVRNEDIAGRRMQVFLIDNDGIILTNTHEETATKSIFDKGMPLYQLASQKGIKTGGMLEHDLNFRIGNEKYIGTVTDVGSDLGWHIVLMQPRAEAFKPVEETAHRIIMVGILALLVGIFLALYRSYRVTKPIGELLDAVEEISQGGYSRRVKIYRRDEIGSLGFAFNKMSSVMEEKINTLQDYQKKLEEAFHQLKNDTSKREEANRELSRKVKELTSLSEVTNKISDSLDTATVLNTIIDAISKVMGFQICSIKLLDHSGKNLNVEISRGMGEDYKEKGTTTIGEGISGLAVKMRKPIVVEDLASDKRIPSEHFLHEMKLKSIISIPLITKQSVMGVLNLYTKNRHVFTEDEKRLLGIFANQAAGAIENAKLFESLRGSYLNTIQALSMAIDAKDRYTHGHSKRVSDISLLIAKEMNFDDDQIDLLKYAADLHDIGKIGISELIISKEGKLTVDEYEIIKTHPLVGETIVEPVPFLQDIKPIIRHHHERWDGYGYPDGLAGEEIPFMSRIILIADAYDAMTSDRPYRKALSHEEAVKEIMKHNGTQFDPKVVDAFLRVFSDTLPDKIVSVTG